MMNYDLIVENAKFVLPYTGALTGALAVKDGKVAGILESRGSGTASRVIDANGMTVIPGVMDAHSHYGLGDSHDFHSESRAAAKAGITSTISYLLQPEADYAEPYEEAKQDGLRHSRIDFGFHFGVSSLEQADGLVTAATDYGVVSHKFFTSFKKPGEGAYIGVNAADDGVLFAIMRAAAADERVLLVVHSETIEVVWQLAEELKQQGIDGLQAWNDSRPPVTEADAMHTTGLFAQASGARVYVPHVSSAAGIAAAERFGAHRPIIETCPHYLTHTYEGNFEGSLGKVNPPLRSAEDLEALWNAVFAGTVDLIGSDHNSRRAEKKLGSIWTSSAGFPGQTTMLPALITAGLKRGLSLTRLTELLSAAPARIFGHYPRKGTLLPGADADFVLIDLDKPRSVDAANTGSHSDYSLDAGVDLVGWPVATFVRGQEAWSSDAGWSEPMSAEFMHAGEASYHVSGRTRQ